MSQPPLVSVSGIRKSFGDLLVCDGVDLDVRPGEVHALLGENGAGKTTLMRIIYGLTTPDAGRIEVDGAPVAISSPRDAIAAGIGMVTQHFALVKPMTVLDNVMLSSSGLGLLDAGGARARLAEAAEQLGVPIDADARIEDLSVGEQQRVEIAKTLYQGARLLILDEPTAVLVPQDAEALFDALRRLTASGIGVLFISHKLHEVAEISDRVSVLRSGHLVDTQPTGTLTAAELAELMVGRSIAPVLRDERMVGVPERQGEAVIDLSHVGADGPEGRPVLEDVTLAVHSGEILALAGVSGNGQRELAEVLSGLRRPDRGRVLVNGQDITGASPAQVLSSGLGRIPEDRHGSVVEDLSVEENLVLEDLAAYRRGPLLDRAAIRRHAEDLIERFAIKASPTDRIGGLSGGNMQKVLLARVLARDPRAILVAQPTRGLDVGAGEYVHEQLVARRGEGAAILLISEDLDEILALGDRIAVMYEGRVMAVLDGATATRQQLGLLMAGHAIEEGAA